MDQSRQMRGLRWALRFMRSIRFRLMIWYVLILALVLLLFGAIVYVLLARALQSEQDSQLTERADQLIASYDPQDNQFHVGADLQNMIREGEVVALLLDPRGDIVQSFAPIPDANVARLAAVATTAPDSRRTFRTVTINLTLRDGGATADYRIYTTPIQDRDQVVGTLVLARPRQDATTLRIFVLALLAAVPMTLLLAAGGAWLAAHAMRPVQTITRTAGRSARPISAGACGCAATTRSASSPPRSTRCLTSWRRRSCASASSPLTPATSYARR